MEESPGYVISDPYGTYFMTFTFVGWVDLLSRMELRDVVIQSFKYCLKNKGLIINGYVLMTSHIHLICRARQNSSGISSIIRDMKKYIAKEVIKWVEEDSRESRSDWLKVVLMYHAKMTKNKSKFQVWQRGSQPNCWSIRNSQCRN